jgi:type I restriction enzyme S subunit
MGKGIRNNQTPTNLGLDLQANGLPTGWEWAELGEIVKVEWGDTSITKKSYVLSGYPAFSATGQDGFLEDYEWEGEAVILSAIGARCGKCFWAEGKWTAIKNTIVVQGDRNFISHRFLLHCLNDEEKWLQTGSGMPFISMSNAQKLRVPLPPLNEQHRIVEKLEKLLERVERAKASIDNVPKIIKQFRRTVLAAACSGRLVEQDPNDEPASELVKRIRAERKKKWEQDLIPKRKDPRKHKYEEPPEPDTSELPDLPSGWVWTTLVQVANIVTGTTPSKSRKDFYGRYIPFIKPGDLDKGENIDSAGEHLSKEGAKQARILPKGSVMVTSIGATIGKTGIACAPVATNQQINSVVCEHGIAPKYAYYYCRSELFQRLMIANASSTTLPIVNKGRFAQLPIAVPPNGEQHRIVAKVDGLFKLATAIESSVTKAQARADNIKQALLAKAFRGELVEQDPNDERASALLERIRLEKEKMKERSKVTRKKVSGRSPLLN